MNVARRTGVFGYIIEVTRIRPIADRWEFAGKVSQLVRYPREGPAETVPHLHLFHEHWGETSEEAVSKVAAEVDAWIESTGQRVGG